MSVEWPAGWPETPPGKRVRSQFANPTHGRAISYVLDEVQRLGRALHLRVRDVKVTTDHERFRRDGLPYSGDRPASPAVAVWFRLGGSPHVMACDAYNRHEDNLWAIGKTIEAKRGILRWKSATGEREFAGYAALPSGDPATDARAHAGRIYAAPEPAKRPPHLVLEDA